MSKCFIISVDSFVTAFSLADTISEIKFKYSKSGNNSSTWNISAGDKVLVYSRKPEASIHILLEALSGQCFKKLFENSEGVLPSFAGITSDLESEECIEIDNSSFNLLVAELLKFSWSENVRVEQEKKQISRVAGAENILLYGVPGVGKSHTIKEEYCNDSTKMERVVFHPDYTYSDFVGQILPRVIEGQLKYVFTPGPFTKLLKKAWENPGEKFYLVIEEINRGNAPAIFGEIFQLLDRKSSENGSYKESEIGESEYGITNYEVAAEVYEDENKEIKIPSNMWILATMNTADQNVFTLDTAFQRRWYMRHIKNDVMAAEHSQVKIEGTEVPWGAFASVINDMIIDISADISSSEDKRLGAYFVKLNELATDQFPEKVLKYLWDDAFKMDKEAIFDEKMKSLEMIIDTYERSEGDKLQAVLRLDVYRKMLETIHKE